MFRLNSPLVEEDFNNAKLFKKQYLKENGIIDISYCDGSLLVFYNSKIFKETIPEDYEGIKISSFDINYILSNIPKMLKSVASNVDINTNETCILFQKALNLCQKLKKKN